jgi:hypothetical protein
MSIAAGAVTSGATASRREEEEQMTAYTRNDLDEGWEFKFLRASTNKFRDPVRLQEILTEEVRAGWTLVEKFDDSRLRLKRPSSARAGDAALPFDPYQKRTGKPITPKERPRGENVVDLMEALRRSVGGAPAETRAPKKAAKKPRKASSGQKEMLMPILGKKQAKETAAKKPAARQQRKSA